MKTGSGNTLSGWERGMNVQLDSPTGEESEAYDQVVQFDRSEYERFDFFWSKDGERMYKQLGSEAFVPAHSWQGKVPSQVPATAYEGSSFQDQKGLLKKFSFSLGTLQTRELSTVITVVFRETTLE